MKKVIAKQMDLFGLISRTIENLEKKGAAKRTRGNVTSRIDNLKMNWAKFVKMDEAVRDYMDAESAKLLYFMEGVREQCEEKFIEAHGDLLDILHELTAPAGEKPSISDSPQAISGCSHSRDLPKISLPTFAGDYLQWRSFRDLFSSMIIDNLDISEVEKLHYLKTSLLNEPAQLLKNIPVSTENFQRAWTTLTARYENTRILIDTQLVQFFSARCAKAESSQNLKRLHGDITEAIGALTSLGCPTEH
ncbi:hypothetical protein DMN91_007816 [Ooceraea biroi]|uniref:Uncharacterized protein n=1 Tax=Ooceraea biroi TaxID=2015173 RepID=A0A3L8DH67_OOCBI|nr:hypothetical protein DMN91_007816 [Ooceraea biroi]